MLRNVYLIFRRDYLGYVKAWGFWLGLASLPLFMIVGAVIAGAMTQASPARYYAVIEDGNRVSTALQTEINRRAARLDEMAEAVTEATGVTQDPTQTGLPDQFTEVPAPARTLDELRPYLLGEKLIDGPEGERPLFAVFIAPKAGGDIEYWSEDVDVSALRALATAGLKAVTRAEALNEAGLPGDFLKTTDASAPQVLERRIRPVDEQAEKTAEVTIADRAPRFAANGMSYMLWLMIFSIIQYLLMGTIEERGNKIFDTLMTSVRVPELLAGKLLAVFGVTTTMMGVWGLFAVIGALVLGSQVPEAGEVISVITASVFTAKMIIPALISFVLGYLLYGALFLSLGALCDTIQEAQTLLSPLMLFLMLPMLAIVIAFSNPGSPMVTAASWFPLFTPFLLILRIPDDPPMWEIALQLGMTAITTLIIVWLAAKIYRAGVVGGASANDIGGLVKRLFVRRAKT